MSRAARGVGLLLLSATWLWWRYRRWLAYHTRRTAAGSFLIQTRLGPVQYDRRGRGPMVLHLHGGNVGHAGWFLLAHLVQAGFTLLTPDRPGYLGTPLGENGAPAAQADLMAALLDELGIEQVAVVGVSAGGPAALQFALRFPERTRGLVLLSAVTRRTHVSDAQRTSALGRLVMARAFQNAAYLLIQQAMKRLPRLTLRDYVRTETTYDQETGRRFIDLVLADPEQRRQVDALADALVPARPRYDGVANDLRVQEALADLPLHQIRAPTLVVHSSADGDVPYANATFAAGAIPNAELIPVAQFGHMIWWGEAQITRAFQARLERHLRACFTGEQASPGERGP